MEGGFVIVAARREAVLDHVVRNALLLEAVLEQQKSLLLFAHLLLHLLLWGLHRARESLATIKRTSLRPTQTPEIQVLAKRACTGACLPLELSGLSAIKRDRCAVTLEYLGALNGLCIGIYKLRLNELN